MAGYRLPLSDEVRAAVDEGVLPLSNAMQLARLPIKQQNKTMLLLALLIHPKLLKSLVDTFLEGG